MLFPNYVPYTTAIPCLLFLGMCVQGLIDIGLFFPVLPYLKCTIMSVLVPVAESMWAPRKEFRKGEQNILNNRFLIDVLYTLGPICVLMNAFVFLLTYFFYLFTVPVDAFEDHVYQAFIDSKTLALVIGIAWTAHILTVIVCFPREGDSYVKETGYYMCTQCIGALLYFCAGLLFLVFTIGEHPVYHHLPECVSTGTLDCAIMFVAIVGCVLLTVVCYGYERWYYKPEPLDDTYEGVWNRRTTRTIMCLMHDIPIGTLTIHIILVTAQQHGVTTSVLLNHKLQFVLISVCWVVSTLYMFCVYTFYPKKVDSYVALDENVKGV